MRDLYLCLLLLLFAPILLKAEIGGTNGRFIENKGQWDSRILFRQDFKSGYILFEKDRFTYTIFDLSGIMEEDGHQHSHGHDVPTYTYQTIFQNSNPNVLVFGGEKCPDYNNYFIGNNPKYWAEKVGIYKSITYQSIYPGINLKVEIVHDQFKYTFEVLPGGNPQEIVLDFEHVQALALSNQGELLLHAGFSTIKEKQPFTFTRSVSGTESIVPCQYSLSGNSVKFTLTNGYDKNQLLVIDPTVIFSTYTGSFQDNWGFTATYDNSGNAYGGGIIWNAFIGSTGYPLMGAYQSSYGGGERDATIIKYNPTGNGLIFSTYLGGQYADQPHSLVVDANDNLFVFGRTSSANFPTTAGAYDPTNNILIDLFITKFSATGTFLASTYLGGSGDDGVTGDTVESVLNMPLEYNYGDDARGEINVDAAGNIYVATCTKSFDFPMVNPVQGTYGGGLMDGIVFKMDNNLTNLLFSTYIGGSAADAAYGINIDNIGYVYTTGGTASANFPTTVNGYAPTYQGGIADGFLLKIDVGNGVILAGTFLGTTGYDQTYSVQIENNSAVYVVGQSTGNFPVIGTVYNNPNSRQFIAKLDNNLSTIVRSTVFGTSGSASPNISPTAFMVDNCGNIYVAGWGGTLFGYNGNSSQTFGLPVTANAFQSNTDGQDFYVIVLSKDMQNLVYATFFGGNGVSEHVDGGTSRFDPHGIMYEAVCAGCGGSSNFPTTAGVWSNTNNSSNCNLGLFKIDLELSGMSASFEPIDSSGTVINIITQGCAPLLVNFDNLSTGNNPAATSYFWDFGVSGATSTAFEPFYTYMNPGIYQVMLIITDTTSCNPTDTAYKSIIVFGPPFVDAGPTQTMCPGGVGVQLTCNAAQGVIHWSPASFVSDSTSLTPIVTPPCGTLFTVAVTDTNGCVATDTVSVICNNYMVLNAGNDSTVCSGQAIQTQAISNGVGQVIYNWVPPTGLSNANVSNPIYTFPGTQTYQVTATDSMGCSASDDIVLSIFQLNVNQNSASVCQGGTVSLQLNISNAQTYSWSPGTYLNSTNVSNPTVTNPQQSVTYQVFVTSLEGCQDSSTYELTVFPLPIAVAGADLSACEGILLQLGGSGGGQYTWSPSIGLSNPFIANPEVNLSSSMQYTLTVTDGNNCVDTDTLAVTIFPFPIITTGSPYAICEGDSVEIQALGGVSYQWAPSTTLSAFNISNPIASPLQDDQYYVVGTDIHGCIGDASVLVTVNPTPITAIVGETDLCLGKPVTLSASGGLTYSWSSGETSPNISFTPTQDFWIYCQAFNEDCPGIPDSMYVLVNTDYPEAEFVANPDTGWAPFPVQFTNLSLNAAHYLWDFGLGNGKRSTETNPLVMFPFAGEFTVMLVAYTERGCYDTIYHKILAENVMLFAPSAFTPNGDGFDDNFLVGYYGIKSLHIDIYSRWGTLIYSSEDKDFRWDGKYKNQECPEGVYVFVATGIGENNQEYIRKGTITLIR